MDRCDVLLVKSTVSTTNGLARADRPPILCLLMFNHLISLPLSINSEYDLSGRTVHYRGYTAVASN